MAKIDSVYDFTDKGLVEVKSWLEPWFLTRCPCNAAAEPLAPFSEAIATLSATRDLRGYWRLGEGAFGPYADTSGYSGGPSDMARVNNTVDMSDLTTGALPSSDDDGAVQFNSSSGLTSDYLQTSNATPFQTFGNAPLTVMGWVKPTASGSTFDGGIISTIATTGGGEFGFSLGVAWPSRAVFFEAHGGRLTGPALVADEWVFVCAVDDGSTHRIYLSGALVMSGAHSDAMQTGSLGPKIGRWHNSTDGVIYGGIDEVSYWGEALSASEIALLAASGGLAEDSTVRSVVSTTAAYTAHINETVLASGTYTVTLPTAVGNSGAEIVAKNTGAGTITVAQAGSETIDGSTTDLTLAAADSVVLVSDGTGWFIISSYSYP